ncbi:MAG TPA: hypothetical protein VGP80_09255 [Gemmatimonadales bacterium]|nr:hypothetical protein [Gemmatimonadales bacterium]
MPVLGDAATLEGQWVGEYRSPETGRSGSIVFSLVAGADTAQGDVLMVPTAPDGYSGSAVPVPDTQPLASQVVHIKLVRVFGQQVAGQLDRYVDPGCQCTVTTIFSGRLEGNVIDGRFFTYHDDGNVAVEGFWSVTRQADRE